MDSGYLAFMEFFIVAAVLIGWGVIELVGLRLDKRRREEERRMARSRAEAEATPPDSTDSNRR